MNRRFDQPQTSFGPPEKYMDSQRRGSALTDGPRRVEEGPPRATWQGNIEPWEVILSLLSQEFRPVG